MISVQNSDKIKIGVLFDKTLNNDFEQAFAKMPFHFEQISVHFHDFTELQHNLDLNHFNRLFLIDPKLELKTKYSFKPLTLIDNQIDHHFSAEFGKDPFDISVIGVQKQLCFKENLIKTVIKSENLIRLGKFRNNPAYIEPIIRNSKSIIVDCRAIRNSELINPKNKFPFGFFTEEISKIFKYAGYSEANKVVILKTKDSAEHYLELLSSFLWYYLEGIQDNASLTESEFREFVVESPFKRDVSFFKNETNGQWWFKFNENESSDLIPCTFYDYKNAIKGDWSERLQALFSLEKEL